MKQAMSYDELPEMLSARRQFGVFLLYSQSIHNVCSGLYEFFKSYCLIVRNMV